jgi:hypothetical protein
MPINKIILQPAPDQVIIGKEHQMQAVLVRRYENAIYSGSEVLEYADEEALRKILELQFPGATVEDKREESG